MAFSTSPPDWHEWDDRHDARTERAVWLAAIAGPVLFLTLQLALYVLAYVACELRQTWFLHVSTAAGLVLVSVLAWHAHRATGVAADE